MGEGGVSLTEGPQGDLLEGTNFEIMAGRSIWGGKSENSANGLWFSRGQMERGKGHFSSTVPQILCLVTESSPKLVE